MLSAQSGLNKEAVVTVAIGVVAETVSVYRRVIYIESYSRIINTPRERDSVIAETAHLSLGSYSTGRTPLAHDHSREKPPQPLSGP